MAKITLNPLHDPQLNNPRFSFDSTNDWLNRYSHPKVAPGGGEPSVYTSELGGTAGRLVFDWLPYSTDNFPAEYFPVLPTGNGASVREVHLIEGTNLQNLDQNSKIASDTLIVEWTNDGGKTIQQYQLVKHEVPDALAPQDFFDTTLPVFLQGSDEIYGTNVKDVINGYLGNDTLAGNDGNDRITGSGGNDTLDGGAGDDTAVFNGNHNDYVINAEQGIVSDSVSNRDGTDTLVDIERLQFNDINVAFDSAKGENAGQAYRIYKAAFDRVPDAEGLGFWINALDQGYSLEQVATTVMTSPEFQRVYGANSSNNTFVNLLYQHVLHRDADADGLNFWNGALNEGYSRGAVLAVYTECPETVGLTAELVASGIQYKDFVG